MSYLTQKTIKNNVSFNGVALHSGLNVNICIKPAEPNFGIVFKRVDFKENNLVYPNFMNVTNTSLNTTIENEFGVKPIIYCEIAYYNRFLKPLYGDELLLWLSDFRKKPKNQFAIWQKTDKYKQLGIKGTVDYNIFNGNKSDLKMRSVRFHLERHPIPSKQVHLESVINRAATPLALNPKPILK